MKATRIALVLVNLLLLTPSCATTPQGRLHQTARTQKIVVDGLGNTYLDICEQIVRPRCVAENEASKLSGSPWDKEDRIACLKPCDSETASSIQAGLDVVLAAQLVVFQILKSGETGPDLETARANLGDAAQHLLRLMESTGARELVESKLFGDK
jgi:hypothetical protein